MAIDNRLQVFNEEGQSVDYDILASDVKFNDGKDLPTKLAEMEEEIEEAGSGDGTVTGVKVGSTTYPLNGDGVVDISPAIPDVSGKANKSEMSVVPGTGANADKTTITLKEGTNATVLTQHQDISGKVDKDPNKELIPSTDLAKLANLPTADQLTTQLGQKANDNAVVKSISVNGQTPQTPTNGNVNIQVQAGEQVSVIQPDPADGTFTIRVGSTDYTVNLNHVHPQYLDVDDIDDYITAGTNVTITKDSQTGALEISASGGGSQVQADWDESDSTSAAYIQNKPTIPSVPTNVSSFTNDAGYLTSHQSLSGRVQSNDVTTIVKLADEAAYTALATKDSSTLYLIPETSA